MNVVTYDDRTRVYSSCHTGWSFALSNELQHLNLNEATSEDAAIEELRRKVESNASYFKEAERRATEMLLKLTSGPSGSQSTSSDDEASE